jgi:hypothetical protein
MLGVGRKDLADLIGIDEKDTLAAIALFVLAGQADLA